MPWMREKISIPDHLKPSQRQMLAEEIIDYIVERSAAGKDKDGKRFKNYSKNYADMKGVDQDEVDLVLSGDMMEELQVLVHKRGEIIIGYEKGADINAKVEGNITGSYGQPEPNKKKARNFLGISKADLARILEDEEYEEPVSEQ